jgi:hypothetical protein
MIDTATIFFSTLMCLFVVFRAIKLDGQIPWFGKTPREAPRQDDDSRNADPESWSESWRERWADRDAP